MNGVEIRAVAHYVPPRVLTNDEISRWVDTSDEWITERTGISTRHISDGENTSDLAVKVAKQLLDAAKLSPTELDLILVATTTGDYNSPTVSCIVQEAIGATNVPALDVNAACTGFIYGFSTAQKFLQSGGNGYKTVMVIGAEVLTKYSDWTDRGTCILFGDGAGGVILSASEKNTYGEKLHARGDKAITVNHQEVENPFSNKKRSLGHIAVDGQEVFKFAVKSVAENIAELMAHMNMSLDEVDYIIPHQANKRIIDGIAKKLKIDLSKFYMNIERFGNTSAASIPIALSEMFKNGILKKGNKVILAGFGGGLTWGSILLEI
ncbi:MAG: ketoacyl-ACP synthase III [Defluviitaleaceae bacterium]|nr:ketoacyl-ACP synthase III [Defluviitaleaceae bacterium]